MAKALEDEKMPISRTNETLTRKNAPNDVLGHY